MTRFNPDRIAGLQTLKGLTAGEFACKVGVQGQYIDKWEKGIRKPGAASLEALAPAFGLAVGFFYPIRLS